MKSTASKISVTTDAGKKSGGSANHSSSPKKKVGHQPNSHSHDLTIHDHNTTIEGPSMIDLNLSDAHKSDQQHSAD